MAEIARTLRLYWRLQRASMRGALQYRLNTVIGIATGVAYQGSGFAFVWVVMHTFPSLAGWSLKEVAFLYGLRLTAHAFYVLPFSSLFGLEFLVREGELDRVLLRPLNPLVQIIARRLGVGQLGDLLAGLVLLVIAAPPLSPAMIAFCLAAVVGGALVEASFALVLASMSLRTLNGFALWTFVDDLFSRFGSYPMSVFGGATQWVLTFVLPVAFVAYVPASVLLDKTGALNVPALVAYGSPLLGVALFALAYQVWRHQLRHYQSAGN
ncbi:ABC-2 family transporter protein [Microtetraspora sp. NBRC 16547]|uniref:ABC transporter permease n=1 Tax=Microtetraspora sp. NBRC 16547 TaxID=3030993 RepID=UPI0024A5458E|nr:ABC-2 family transporter protein [Microtetraspora sp. NBRC 16547]GLW99892.1 ABC transporter permease [Microtetraspora sp. NBRC 16547]